MVVIGIYLRVPIYVFIKNIYIYVYKYIYVYIYINYIYIILWCVCVCDCVCACVFLFTPPPVLNQGFLGCAQSQVFSNTRVSTHVKRSSCHHGSFTSRDHVDH